MNGDLEEKYPETLSQPFVILIMKDCIEYIWRKMEILSVLLITLTGWTRSILRRTLQMLSAHASRTVVCVRLVLASLIIASM